MSTYSRFYQFLVSRDAYFPFLDNLRQQRDMDLASFFEYEQYYIQFYPEFIFASAFDWECTPEGSSYWSRLSFEWGSHILP